MPTSEPEQKNYEFVQTMIELWRKHLDALPVEIFEADGTHVFRYAYGGLPGVVGMEFYAHGLADWSHRVAERIWRETIVAYAAGQPDGEDILKRADERMSDPAHVSDVSPEIIQWIAYVFVRWLSGKMSSLLGEAELEIECYMRAITFRSVGVKSDDGVKRLAREMAAERQNFLAGSIAYFGKRDYSEMRAHYEILLPLAKRAKQLYRDNRDRDWRGMIERGFAEFDKDVIGLFSEGSDDMADYPAVITENFKTAADIALLQAARVCGMRGFECTSPRTLRDWMDKSGAVKTDAPTVSPDRTKRVKTPRAASSLKETKSVKRPRQRRTQKKLVSAKAH